MPGSQDLMRLGSDYGKFDREGKKKFIDTIRISRDAIMTSNLTNQYFKESCYRVFCYHYLKLNLDLYEHEIQFYSHDFEN